MSTEVVIRTTYHGLHPGCLPCFKQYARLFLSTLYGGCNAGIAFGPQQLCRLFCMQREQNKRRSHRTASGKFRRLAVSWSALLEETIRKFAIIFSVAKPNRLYIYNTLNFLGDQEAFPPGGGTDGSRPRGLQEGGLPHDQVKASVDNGTALGRSRPGNDVAVGLGLCNHVHHTSTFQATHGSFFVFPVGILICGYYVVPASIPIIKALFRGHMGRVLFFVFGVGILFCGYY